VSWAIKGLLFAISLPLAWGPSTSATTLTLVLAIPCGCPRRRARIACCSVSWLVSPVPSTGCVQNSAAPDRRLAGCSTGSPHTAQAGPTLSVEQPPASCWCAGSGCLTAGIRRPSESGHSDSSSSPGLDDRWHRSGPSGMGVVEAGMILGLTASGDIRVRCHRGSLHPATVQLIPAPALGWFTLLCCAARVCLTKVPAWLCDFRTLSGSLTNPGAVRRDGRRAAHRLPAKRSR